MRNLFFAALCGLWCATALGQQPGDSSQPATQQPGQAAAAVNQGAQESGSHTARSNDPNYRYYNGRWWYWQNGGYLMWNGSRWLTPQERRTSSYVPGRSYSYYDPSAGGAPIGGYYPYYQYGRGNPRDWMPDSVANPWILNSFGIRAAGSKALGKY